VVAVLGCALLEAQELVELREQVLPPVLEWSGASEQLVVAADDPWITPGERAGFETTPSYGETVAWLEQLVAAAPELEMVSLGTSLEGRELWMVIASGVGTASPEDLHAESRPVVLVQAGIHAGEIDGKDAGLMLLRDLTVGGTLRSLLEKVSLLFIPIVNPDGHERSSAYSRMNQRGPREMGWRTNARNLNLNRDYAKLDTVELRAVVAAIDRWQPDLYLDLHTTDGADYQYDVTFGWNSPNAYSPAIARWLDATLRPAVSGDLEAAGHIPGPFVWLVDRLDPSVGVVEWTASPRYSNGYGDARHLPTVLVETHSLKPHRQRVLGVRVLLESVLRVMSVRGEELRAAVVRDRAQEREQLVFTWSRSSVRPVGEMRFLGVEARLRPSLITGVPEVEWTGKPIAVTAPVLAATEPEASVNPPAAYWIPPQWTTVIERLEAHGIQLERAIEPREVTGEVYHLDSPVVEPDPFEGRVRVTAEPRAVETTVTLPAGAVRVGMDQPLGDLAALLLEPASPDSFFQWGFFLEVLQRTEYFERYVMEPLARRMLAADPELEAELMHKLREDPDFAASPRARLMFFYERTPFMDDRYRVYPVVRELAGATS
jgi:murein tripeptide amidase MpaA